MVLQKKHSLATLALVVHVERDGTDDDHDDQDDWRCDGGLAPGLRADDGVLADVAELAGEVLLALALRLPGLGLHAEAAVLALAHQWLWLRLLVGRVTGCLASRLELDVVRTLAPVAGGDDQAEMGALGLVARVGDAGVVPARVEHLDGRRVLEVGRHGLGDPASELVHLHHLPATTSGSLARPEHLGLKDIDGDRSVEVGSPGHDVPSLSILGH